MDKFVRITFTKMAQNVEIESKHPSRMIFSKYELRVPLWSLRIRAQRIGLMDY